MKENPIKGRLYLYSEQGMEGGQLAFIDKNYIKLQSPKYGLQENRKVWDKNDNTKIGTTDRPETYKNNTWLPSRDPILDESDYKISSLFCGEERGDYNADKRLMKKFNFQMKYTKDRANYEYGEGNWQFLKPNSEILLNDGSRIIMGGTPNSIPNRPYPIPSADFSRVTVHWNNGTIETKRLSNTLLVEKWSYEGLQMLKETDLLKVIDPKTNLIICEGQVNQIPLKLFSQTMKGHFKHTDEIASDWEKYFTEEYNVELHR